MDTAPPDTKRQRLSWSTSTPQGVTLPHPHSQHPVTQLPPPGAHHPPPRHHPGTTPGGQGPPHPPPPPPINTQQQQQQHHHQPPHTHPHPAPGPYHSYPPRTGADHSSAPPTPAPLQSPADQYHEAERRHHDQDPHAPMQDHYRQQQPRFPHQSQQPPHSPAHPAYPPYPQRDSGIKREAHDDPRRPSSTGHAPDALPPPPHAASTPHPLPPHPSPSYPDNPPRHMSYDNGPSMTPAPPGSYRHPNYPPPTPISQQPPPYDQHGGYSTPSEPFYSIYSSAAAAKKKNTRASQACDQCRQLKAKCDETKPCKTCRDKGTECRYRDPVPKATDKAQADILEGITAMQNSLVTLTEHMGRMDRRLTTIEGVCAKPSNALHVKSDLARHDEYKSAPVTPLHTNGGFGSSLDSYQTSNGGSHEPISSTADVMPLRMMGEDEIEAEPGPPVPPGEPAIPINHTTLAGLLLEWPSIREMTQHHLDQQGVKYISEFPISQEQKRGSLIVYGRGEDSHYSRHSRIDPDHGTLDMADDSSDAASPSPAADFGHLGGLSPPDQVEYKGGVLGVDGNPDFAEAKVWQYVESFKENVLNLHPIIQPKELHVWVRYFLDTLPSSQPRSAKPNSTKPTFAVGGSGINSQLPNENPGSKRKRSPAPDAYDASGIAPPAKAGKPARNLHSALVLTVLALGKLSLHRDAVPDVVFSTEMSSNGSPFTRNGVLPSPGHGGSPPGFSSQSHSSGLPSPMEQERGHHSRRSSFQGGMAGVRLGYSLKKNYEVIPGLEYFAYATDILGNHVGTYNNIKSVYANIFAGLYHGQIGRPMESFAFIHKASHNLQVIMRPSLDKLRKFKLNSEFIVEHKYNQLALAFWTCLQLESDLIAELPLPPSGLLSYEDDMPHPNMSLLTGFDQRVLDSYPGQLYLRTHLNSIHRMFYAPEDPNKPGKDKFKNVSLVADSVSGMNWVAPSLSFKEEDAPADDILAARLRAKYWGAQSITYRPFIRQILQFAHSIKKDPTNPNVQPQSEFREGIIAPSIQPTARTLKDIDPQVVDLARKGIKALIESTRAFHGLGDKRLLITNVFGTAHAQWGNLLVLSAAYRDPVLRQYVDEDLLKGLFHKTIQFLRQSAAITSSLRVDMNILEGLQADLFHAPDLRMTSSFSSQGQSARTPTQPTSATLPSHE